MTMFAQTWRGPMAVTPVIHDRPDGADPAPTSVVARHACPSQCSTTRAPDAARPPTQTSFADTEAAEVPSIGKPLAFQVVPLKCAT
jgi:hypothetical protein